MTTLLLDPCTKTTGTYNALLFTKRGVCIALENAALHAQAKFSGGVLLVDFVDLKMF